MRIKLAGFGFVIREIPVVLMALTIERIFAGSPGDYLPKAITVEREGLTWLWRPRTDDYLAFSAKHEPSVTKLLTTQFRKGEVFLDIGSHVGRYAVRASREGMKVHAWEPNPYNRYGLVQNLKMNNLRAKVHTEALGDTDGFVLFQNRGGRSHVTKSGKSKVQMRRLDGFDIPEVDLVKIDTPGALERHEGFELPILAGAKRTLRTHHPRLLVELHRHLAEDSTEECRDLLKTLGYSEFTYITDMGRRAYLFCP